MQIKIPEGSASSVKVTLKPGSSSATDSGLIFGRPRKRFIAGAAIAGSGILILGIGIAVLRSGCLADVLGTTGCETSCDPATIAGGSMIGIGVLLGGVGGILMGIPARK